MRVLVTGGAGYIGSHTIIELLEKTDWEVVSIDNYSNSSIKVYDHIKKIVGREFLFEDVDICDANALNTFFRNSERFDGIIHFAAFKAVGESVEFPLKYYRNNLGGLANVLSCVEKYNVSSFLFSSSCSVYGNPDTFPVTESTPYGKIESPYANTKKIGEEMLLDVFHKNSNGKAMALRYFNPVGAHVSGDIGEFSFGKPANLVPIITKVAIGEIPQLKVFGTDYNTRDGSCIRDYIHVGDVAIAHVRALKFLYETQNVPYEVLNLGTGKGITVLEMIKAFEKVSGESLPYLLCDRRPGDVEAIYADNSKANALLDWSPSIDLETMMLSAWKWEQNFQKEHN